MLDPAPSAARWRSRTSPSAARPERPTLDDVTLPSRGTTTAIVGETGSGKTTLGYLVARLYDADAGRVTIDGHDVRELSFPSLADAVGVVSQETYLVHATSENPVRRSRGDRPGDRVGAQAAGITTSSPRFRRATTPSSGSAATGSAASRPSRTADRPAKPADPGAGRGDEPFDTETERAVQEALERLSEGRTVIAIAHRLSTVRDADQIVVLDDGRIVERGTHDELAGLGGHYAAMLTGAGELDPV